MYKKAIPCVYSKILAPYKKTKFKTLNYVGKSGEKLKATLKKQDIRVATIKAAGYITNSKWVLPSSGSIKKRPVKVSANRRP